MCLQKCFKSFMTFDTLLYMQRRHPISISVCLPDGQIKVSPRTSKKCFGGVQAIAAESTNGAILFPQLMLCWFVQLRMEGGSSSSSSRAAVPLTGLAINHCNLCAPVITVHLLDRANKYQVRNNPHPQSHDGRLEVKWILTQGVSHSEADQRRKQVQGREKNRGRVIHKTPAAFGLAADGGFNQFQCILTNQIMDKLHKPRSQSSCALNFMAEKCVPRYNIVQVPLLPITESHHEIHFYRGVVMGFKTQLHMETVILLIFPLTIEVKVQSVFSVSPSEA